MNTVGPAPRLRCASTLAQPVKQLLQSPAFDGILVSQSYEADVVGRRKSESVPPGLLIDAIRAKGPELTGAQRDLAAFVLEHSTEAALLSSHALADRVGVSPSSVVRFARALGYDGFPSFQRALQEVLKHNLSIASRLQSTLREGQSSGFLSANLTQDITALQQTIEQIPPADFDRVVEAVSRAGAIYLIGIGKAAIVVDFLAFRLRRVGKPVITATTGGRVPEALLSMQRGDVLMCVAFQRPRPEVAFAIELARSKGSTVVCLAENSYSDHARQADHALCFSRGPGERINSLAVPMAVAHALCMAVADVLQAETLEAYEWIEAYRQRFASGPAREEDGE